MKNKLGLYDYNNLKKQKKKWKDRKENHEEILEPSLK